MITPKKTFQLNKRDSETFLNVVDSPLFARASEAALAEMQLNMGQAPDMGTAAAAAWKLQGAVNFLRTLMDLPVVNVREPAATVAKNLKQT